MAVIGPYDRASFAEYTPLSAQDILMPAMVMAQQHEQLENQYNSLNDELQKVKFVADSDPNKEVSNRYNNYYNSLNTASQDLMNQGVNANTRSKALALRSAYQSQIAPINAGYQMKLQEINNYNAQKLKDPTFIGNNPSHRSVMDYINNGLQPFGQQGISGAMVTKQAADMAEQISQKAQSGDPQTHAMLKGMFGPQYYQVINKYGMDPTSNDPAVQKYKNYIRNSVLSGYDLGWTNPNQQKELLGYVDQGLAHLQGKDQIQTEKNLGWDYKMWMEQQRQLRKATKEQEVPNDIFRTVPDTQTNDVNTKQLYNDREFVKQIHNNPKLANTPTRVKVPVFEGDDPGLQGHLQPQKYTYKTVYANNDRWNALVKKYGTNNTTQLIHALNQDIGSSAQRNTGYMLNMTDNSQLNKSLKDNVVSMISKTGETGLYKINRGEKGKDPISPKDISKLFEDGNIEFNPKLGLVFHTTKDGKPESYGLSPELLDDKNRTYSHLIDYINNNIRENDYESANVNISNLMKLLYKQHNTQAQVQGKTLSQKEEYSYTR